MKNDELVTDDAEEYEEKESFDIKITGNQKKNMRCLLDARLDDLKLKRELEELW